MFRRFIRTYLVNARQGLITARALAAYRRAHEALRHCPVVTTELEQDQISLACQTSGLDRDIILNAKQQWFEREAMALLSAHLFDGLREFLVVCRTRGIHTGVVSDYPAARKLEALGLESYFEVAICAQDRSVQALKPNPRGLRVALERLGVKPADAIYIGDRCGVDDVAALAAGVCPVILKRSRRRNTAPLCVSDYHRLRAMMFPSG